MVTTLKDLIFTTIMNSIIGLCVFLYGINLLTNSLERITEKKFEHIIYTYTNTTFKCFLIGVILTAITSSSTAVTAITLSFISSKHLTFKKGLIIVVASNIGTSFSSLLFSFDFSLFVPFLLLLASIIYMFYHSNKNKVITSIIYGLGYLFFGLNYLVKNLEILLRQESFSTLLNNLNVSSFSFFIIGIIVTALIQSSSAGIGMIQKLSNSNVILLKSSIAFMLGANIGTTFTGCIASFVGTKDSKKVAFINFLFNFIGSIIFMVLISQYERCICILGKVLNLTNAAMVSLSHIIYNITTVLIFLFFLTINKKRT